MRSGASRTRRRWRRGWRRGTTAAGRALAAPRNSEDPGGVLSPRLHIRRVPKPDRRLIPVHGSAAVGIVALIVEVVGPPFEFRARIANDQVDLGGLGVAVRAHVDS